MSVDGLILILINFCVQDCSYMCVHYLSIFAEAHSLIISFPPFAVLTPLHYVAYLGQPDVRFHCSAANASELSWDIYDDIFWSSNRTMGISFEMDHLGSNLTISPLPMISSTCVQCRANTSDRIMLSLEAVLQVQGQSANVNYSELPL